MKAKHISNANTKTKREREKVIESLEALFLPHLGRTIRLSEPLNQRWGGEELKSFKFERNMRALRRSLRGAKEDGN